ncbi:MAG: tetratricopeptide repeat protein [Candidatus Muiribacteriota bacterium]
MGNVFGKIIDKIESADKIIAILQQRSKIKDNAGAETEFTIARNYFDSGDYGNAFTHLKKSVLLNYSYSVSYLYISKIYQEKNLFQDARKLLEACIKYNPSYIIYSELASVYLRSGMKMKISDLWKKYIDKFPDNEKGYLNLGNFYASMGQNGKAISIFEKVLKIKKDNTSVKEEIADIYLNGGKNKEAGDILREIFDSTEVSGMRAEYGRKLLDIYLAENELKKALEIASELQTFVKEEKVFIKISDVYLACGIFEEALNFLNRIRKVNPLNYAVYFRYAFIYSLKENKEEVYNNLKFIIKFNENSKVIRLLNDFDQITSDELKEKTGEIIVTNSEIKNETVRNLIENKDMLPEPQEEDKIEIKENIENNQEDEFTLRTAVKTLEEINNFFEKQMENQSRLIGIISRLIEKNNYNNMEEVSKIFFFNNEQIKYVLSRETQSKEEFHEIFNKIKSGIKKSVYKTSKGNKRIYNKINEFRKKNLETQGILEKYLYQIEKINRKIELDEDIESIIDSLKKLQV